MMFPGKMPQRSAAGKPAHTPEMIGDAGVDCYGIARGADWLGARIVRPPRITGAAAADGLGRRSGPPAVWKTIGAER